MEFEGRIQKVLAVRSGTSKNGNDWKSLPFVFEYFESADQRWSDKVLLETLDTNIMSQISAYLQKGADNKAVVENGEMHLTQEVRCKVGFSHSVRSGQRQDGTTFHANDVRLYKFEILTGIQVPQQPAMQQAVQTPVLPPVQQGYGPQQQGGGDDDELPF